MSNRVEDLETQVAELQAAVNGLTEELVEMKERVRQLESGQADVTRDAQPAAGPENTGPTERTTASDAHADVVETTAADGDAAADAATADATGGDDVLVAGEDDPAGAEATDDEATKNPASQDTEDDGESEDSDIIVA